MKKLNFVVMFGVVFIAVAFLVGCGGGGSGEKAVIQGQIIGAWSDAKEEDQGLFACFIRENGELANGRAWAIACDAASESLTGWLSKKRTKLDFRFRESQHCHPYRMELSGRPVEPFQSGWAAVVTAKYYDVSGQFVGQQQLSVYFEIDRSKDRGANEAEERLVGLAKEYFDLVQHDSLTSTESEGIQQRIKK